jgi:hypothetical protein
VPKPVAQRHPLASTIETFADCHGMKQKVTAEFFLFGSVKKLPTTSKMLVKNSPQRTFTASISTNVNRHSTFFWKTIRNWKLDENFSKTKKKVWFFFVLEKCESSTFSLFQKVVMSGKKNLEKFFQNVFQNCFWKICSNRRDTLTSKRFLPFDTKIPEHSLRETFPEIESRPDFFYFFWKILTRTYAVIFWH